MDQIIAEREGMSISDIFEVYGEQYFRDLETNLLIEMQSRTNVVISCGGGTPMRECNVVEMKKNGRVVLLTAKPETILDRVKDSHDTDRKQQDGILHRGTDGKTQRKIRGSCRYRYRDRWKRRAADL